MSVIKDLFKGGIEGVFGGADKIIDSFVEDPNKKTEAKLKLKELQNQSTKDLYEFSLNYEGKASEVPKWILALRSLIRPVVTICLFFSLIFFIGYDIVQIFKGSTEFILSKLPSQYWIVLNIVLAFWFGGKIGENIIDKIKK